ncbi:MAG: malto-oligosyltrehalose trehalohydrolase [Hydrogenophaga sp.]
MQGAARRRLPVGAEVQTRGVHFRVWAPRARQVEAVIEESGQRAVLAPEDGGYHSGLVAEAAAGHRYRYLLDGTRALPDPASRFQPEGPNGPSEIVDPSVFTWRDEAWRGLDWRRQIIYELHVGTFTEEGTWAAARQQLQALTDLGITCIELLPVADFVGRFGWGYDGVDLFAPTRLYGTPDEMRRFVDEAHAYGLGVILDVVYNHFGPEGNYLGEFSDSFVHPTRVTDWGAATNFDGPGCGPVREFFLANASYWIDEFHLDGLRLDATQDIHDASADHIIAAVTRRAREAGQGRPIYVIAENEPQKVKLMHSPEQGGYGVDALWNDDFHHSAMVAMTGRNEAYYTDYHGKPQELVSAAKHAFLYQGQRYLWQRKRRGTPTFGIPGPRFIHFLDNHDQVANSGRGLRCHMLTSPGRFRAMSALLMLAPQTPLIFQGQEFAASSPFFYFADHRDGLARNVRDGRAEFLAQFRSLAQPEMQSFLPDPADPGTFIRSKLNLAERELHRPVYRMYRDLIALRRGDAVFSNAQGTTLDGAVLGPESFVLRFFSPDDERLLVVNLGRDLQLEPAPEPLIAPPEGCAWHVIWSSENPIYGGRGTSPWDYEESWWIPGHSAVVLVPRARR